MLIYANKSPLAYLGGENYKNKDVEKELPQMLENLNSKNVERWKKHAWMVQLIMEWRLFYSKIYSYEKGIEFLANRKITICQNSRCTLHYHEEGLFMISG